MNIKKLNRILNEVTAEEIEFKSIILPGSISPKDIHKKYPEVRFTSEQYRTKEEAKDWIYYFGKPGTLYALKIGYNEKWLIGGFLRFDESLQNFNVENGLDESIDDIRPPFKSEEEVIKYIGKKNIPAWEYINKIIQEWDHDPEIKPLWKKLSYFEATGDMKIFKAIVNKIVSLTGDPIQVYSRDVAESFNEDKLNKANSDYTLCFYDYFSYNEPKKQIYIDDMTLKEAIEFTINLDIPEDLNPNLEESAILWDNKTDKKISDKESNGHYWINPEYQKMLNESLNNQFIWEQTINGLKTVFRNLVGFIDYKYYDNGKVHLSVVDTDKNKYIKELKYDSNVSEEKMMKDVEDIMIKELSKNEFLNESNRKYEFYDEEDISILTFKFNFERKDNTLICKNEYGYEIEIELEEADEEDLDMGSIVPEKDYIEQEIVNEIDFYANGLVEEDIEITSSEVVDFKYNEETKKGSFEFNIFYETEKDESLNEESNDLMEVENLIIVGAEEPLRDRLKEKQYIISIEPYYGKTRKTDGVLVKVPEDAVVDFEQFLIENNLKYYDYNELNEEFDNTYQVLVGIVDDENSMEVVAIEDTEEDAIERAKYEYTHSDLDEDTLVEVVWVENGETIYHICSDCEEKLNESIDNKKPNIDNMTQCVIRIRKIDGKPTFAGVVEENTHYRNQTVLENHYKNRLAIEDDNVSLVLAYHPGEVYNGKELYDMFGELYTFDLNEDEDDDYEDEWNEDDSEMHKEVYIAYFSTPAGQKMKTYHVYTDSTDDSYNELCDKHDNQIGLYDTFSKLKDAMKTNAEDLCKKNGPGYELLHIDGLGEDTNYYLTRNKYESVNEQKEDFRYGKDLEKGHKYTLSKANTVGFDSKDFTEKELQKIMPYINKRTKGDSFVFELKRDTKLTYKGKFRGYNSIKMEIENTGVILEMSFDDVFKEIISKGKINEALGSAEYEHAVDVGIEAIQELKRDFDFTTRDFGDSFEPEVDEDFILKFLSKVENFLTYLKDYDILDTIDSQETVNKYFEDLIEIIRR